MTNYDGDVVIINLAAHESPSAFAMIATSSRLAAGSGGELRRLRCRWCDGLLLSHILWFV